MPDQNLAYSNGIEGGGAGDWLDHARMVIDMNLSSRRTVDQIWIVLAGTSDVCFSVPGDQLARRTFVEEVLPTFAFPAPFQEAVRGLMPLPMGRLWPLLPAT